MLWLLYLVAGVVLLVALHVRERATWSRNAFVPDFHLPLIGHSLQARRKDWLLDIVCQSTMQGLVVVTIGGILEAMLRMNYFHLELLVYF